MREQRVYHGWIMIEQERGFKDRFSVSWNDVEHGGNTTTKFTGYGELGAIRAVAHFEEVLKLGRVQLEQTPLGLRVFTIPVPEEGV